MKVQHALLACCLSLVSSAFAGAVPLGFNVQVYPAGLITEGTFVVQIEAQHALVLRAGYNFTDRQDFGKHENEAGGGPGLSLGYRYLFDSRSAGWFLGARADLWFMDVDWDDPGRSGSTEITVLQPTAEAGYTFPLSDHWRVQPFLALGAEINVESDGEDVGEGAIVLGGFTLSTAL